MEGWISIYRKIQEHWLWTKKRRFSEFEAWMSLLFKANHKATQLMIYKTVVDLKAGSFITSELKLADKWGWSRETVRKFLKRLEEEKMLLVQHTTKYTIVSIENWELYQNSTQQNRQQIIGKTQQNGQERTLLLEECEDIGSNKLDNKVATNFTKKCTSESVANSEERGK